MTPQSGNRCSLRPLREADMRYICGFFNNEKELAYSFPDAEYPLSENALINSVESRYDSSVLLIDGEPGGFANLFGIVNGVECFLGNVIIDKRRRRIGAAFHLIEGMSLIAVRSYGVKKIIAPCWSENVPAVTAYTKLGFRPREIILRDFQRFGTVPVLMLEKSLT